MESAQTSRENGDTSSYEHEWGECREGLEQLQRSPSLVLLWRRWQQRCLHACSWRRVLLGGRTLTGSGLTAAAATTHRQRRRLRAGASTAIARAPRRSGRSISIAVGAGAGRRGRRFQIGRGAQIAERIVLIQRNVAAASAWLRVILAGAARTEAGASQHRRARRASGRCRRRDGIGCRRRQMLAASSTASRFRAATSDEASGILVRRACRETRQIRGGHHAASLAAAFCALARSARSCGAASSSERNRHRFVRDGRGRRSNAHACVRVAQRLRATRVGSRGNAASPRTASAAAGRRVVHAGNIAVDGRVGPEVRRSGRAAEIRFRSVVDVAHNLLELLHLLVA